MRKAIIALITAIILLVSCAQPVPNMVIGAYVLRDPQTKHQIAALALKGDGTFIYVETLTESSEYQVRVNGTYQLITDKYNHLAASGAIDFAVPDDGVPEGIDGLLIPVGATRYEFYWACDNSAGPLKITLITDYTDSSKNYTFSYIGLPDSLDNESSILPDEMMPETPDETPDEGQGEAEA